MFIYYRRFLENIQFSWNTQIKKEDKERDRHSSTIAGVKKKKTSIHVRRVEVGPPFGVFFQKTCGRSFPVWNPLSTRPKIVIVPCACLFYYTGDSSYAADGRGCCFIYLDRLAQTKNLPPLLLLLLLYLWSAHDRAVAYKIVYSLFFIQFHSVALSWQPIITLYGGWWWWFWHRKKKLWKIWYDQSCDWPNLGRIVDETTTDAVILIFVSWAK
jgi:hypothetical protein